MPETNSPMPLVTIVSADPDTVGALLCAKLKEKCSSLKVVLGAREGLFLEEVVGRKRRSFSLRYHQIGDASFAIPIGRDLPEHRYDHVVNCILAMIRRGRVWTDGHRTTFSEAYGPTKQRHAKKPLRFPRVRAETAIWC